MADLSLLPFGTDLHLTVIWIFVQPLEHAQDDALVSFLGCALFLLVISIPLHELMLALQHCRAIEVGMHHLDIDTILLDLLFQLRRHVFVDCVHFLEAGLVRWHLLDLLVLEPLLALLKLFGMLVL